MYKLRYKVNWLKLFLIVSIIIGFSINAFALDPEKSTTQYIFKSWRDQFPQNTIITITQTKDGYIWFGTFEGLVRFDGVKFAAFDQTNLDLPGRSILSLVSDNENLWIGTIRGLCYLSKGKITTYTSKDGLVNDAVYSLTKDKKGNLWVGTSNGLSYFKDGKFTNYTIKDGLLSNFIQSIKEDSLGRLWVGTAKGLNLFQDGKFIPYTAKDSFVWDIFEDKDGVLWVGTLNGLLKIQNENITTYTTKDGLNTNGVRQVKKDKDGNLWIGTVTGLNRLTNGQFTALTSYKDLSVEDIVVSLFEDIEGNIWVGTHRGLTCIKNGKFFLRTTMDGLSSDYTRTVMESSKGGLWVGTGAGLNYLSEDRKITIYTTKDGLPMNNIRALYEDDKGNLWVGTDTGGVSSFNNAKFTTYTTNDGLSSNNITSLLGDLDGSLWIGTYGGGISRFKDGKFTNYTTKDGLLNDIVRCIFIDKTGVVWVGTLGGLNQIKEGKLVSLNEEHFYKKQFFCFYNDGESLWMSTDEGLIRYKDGKAKIYTTKEGLFDNLAFGILETNNTLWFSCNKGIYAIEKKEFDDYDNGLNKTIKCKAYGKSDGMPSSQCNGANQPACWKTKDNKLCFPTVNGLVIIDSQEVKLNELIPSVKIEKVSLNDAAVDLYKEVSLPYSKDKLKFYFTCLSFIAPEKVKFKYKLEGFDQDWSKEDTTREVSYTNLSPGKYQFKAIACNNDGLWNMVGDSYSFLILPPWWMTWWAYGSYFFIGIAMIFGLVRFQTEKVRQKAKVALQKEKELSKLREAELRAETAELRAKSIEAENLKKAEELAYARQLQLSMLPKENISFDKVEIVGHMRTATEVGGDYYDFIKIDDHRYFLAIGDATGHGVGAGLLVAMVKALLVNIVDSLKQPSPLILGVIGKIMASVNTSLKYLLPKKGIGMALTIAIFDSKTMTIEICSNAMPYPCIYRHQTKDVEVIELKGPPLGFLKEIKTTNKVIKLNAGDKLLFVSDGFSERMNKENKIWGYYSLVNQVKSICCQHSDAKNIIEELNLACDNFSQGIANSDDMTVLILDIKNP